MSKLPKRLMTAATMRQITEKAKRRIALEEEANRAERDEKLKREQEAAIRRTAPRLVVSALETIAEAAYKGQYQIRIESRTNLKHGLAIMSNVATRLQELGYRCSTIAGTVPEVGQFVTRDKKPVTVTGYSMMVMWSETEKEAEDKDNWTEERW